MLPVGVVGSRAPPNTDGRITNDKALPVLSRCCCRPRLQFVEATFFFFSCSLGVQCVVRTRLLGYLLSVGVNAFFVSTVRSKIRLF